MVMFEDLPTSEASVMWPPLVTISSQVVNRDRIKGKGVVLDLQALDGGHTRQLRGLEVLGLPLVAAGVLAVPTSGAVAVSDVARFTGDLAQEYRIKFRRQSFARVIPRQDRRLSLSPTLGGVNHQHHQPGSGWPGKRRLVQWTPKGPRTPGACIL
ncbi:hypothetical protein VTK56DRAFT_4813 [Thermocarpiscus australiensis]